MDRGQRKHEERVLLYKVFTEDAKTDEERIICVRNAQLIEKSLELMRVGSLLGLGQRKARFQLHQAIENLMEQEMQERYELGLMPLTKIKLDDIQSVMYKFFFKIIKVKKKAVKKIRYNNSLSIVAQDIESARSQLAERLKKLGDQIVEEISVTKKIHAIRTVDGEFYSANEIEIEQ